MPQPNAYSLQELHDVLHPAFAELHFIFPAYCKTIQGGDDVMSSEEMDMTEWLNFCRECKIPTKNYSRGLLEMEFDHATIHMGPFGPRDMHPEL